MNNKWKFIFFLSLLTANAAFADVITIDFEERRPNFDLQANMPVYCLAMATFLDSEAIGGSLNDPLNFRPIPATTLSPASTLTPA